MSSQLYHQKPPKKHPVLWGLFILTTLGITLTCGLIQYTLKDLPTLSREQLVSAPSSNIYAKNGDIIWSSSDNYRLYTPLEEIPDTFKELLLSVEDYEFYQNPGFNPKGLVNAGLSYITNKLGFSNQLRGGSSIEQQLIKLSTDEHDQTIPRKIKEFFLANQLSRNYSKDQILEFYLNKLFLGQNAYGVGTIAKIYYGKPLKDLNLSQQALIAGLGQAPSKFDLYANPKAVKNRRDTVLQVAFDRGLIDEKTLKEAKSQPVDEGLKPKGWLQESQDEATLYYSSYIEGALNDVKALGYDLDCLDLQIYTALDTNLYQAVKDLWDDPNSPYFQDKNQQGAITITDPRNGQVLMELGGRFIDKPFGFNRATSVNRSTGSAIKPFLVAKAIDQLNLPSNYQLDSSNYHYPDSDAVATNYGGVEEGNVTLWMALSKSLNTPMLRLLDQLTLPKYQAFLNQLGFGPFKDLNLTHALGIDASTHQITQALSALSQYGTYHPSQYVTDIVFADGSKRTIQKETKQVLSQDAAFITTQILQDDPFKIENLSVAIKTGTVAYPDNSPSFVDPKTDAMDLWLTGYTNNRTIAIWLGYDQPFEANSQLKEQDLYQSKKDLFEKVLNLALKEEAPTPWEQPGSTYSVGSGHLQGTPLKSVLKTPLIETNQYLYNLLLGNQVQSYNNQFLDPFYQQIPKTYYFQDWLEDYKRVEALELDRAKERQEKGQLIGEEELENEEPLHRRYGLPRYQENDDLDWKSVAPNP